MKSAAECGIAVAAGAQVDLRFWKCPPRGPDPEDAPVGHDLLIPLDKVGPGTIAWRFLGQERSHVVEAGERRAPGTIQCGDRAVAGVHRLAERRDRQRVGRPPPAMVVVEPGVFRRPAPLGTSRIDAFAIDPRDTQQDRLDHARISIALGERLQELLDARAEA